MKTVKEFVEALIASGMTEGEIAQSVGCGQSTVHRMKHGADARYSTGKAVEKLYHRRCVMPPQAAPHGCKAHR